MRLNVDADRPSPFYHIITFPLFSNNFNIRPTFSSVPAEWLLPELLLLLFWFLLTLWYFTTLFWMDLLQGDLRLNMMETVPEQLQNIKFQ